MTIIPPRVRFLMRMEWIFRHWLELWLILFTLYNIFPYFAPLAMNTGLDPLGNLIYDAYGMVSHQFAHRSYFFFGEQLMYSPEELPIELGEDVFTNESAMRQFRGNENLGWKIGWSAGWAGSENAGCKPWTMKIRPSPAKTRLIPANFSSAPALGSNIFLIIGLFPLPFEICHPGKVLRRPRV